MPKLVILPETVKREIDIRVFAHDGDDRARIEITVGSYKDGRNEDLAYEILDLLEENFDSVGWFERPRTEP